MFHVSYCNKGEFNCTNGHCISASNKCDGKNDCGDNSDEELPSCKTCFSNEFKCDNGNCISNNALCDQVNDCPSGEDERDCSFEPKRCDEDQFECANRLECINKHWVCDRNSKLD